MARIGLLTSLVILPLAAAANGGPVDYPDDGHMASGGLVPLQETTVALVSERLKITLLDSPYYAWKARAEYELSNPGKARTVRFGVPLQADYALTAPIRGEDPRNPLAEWSGSAWRGIKITVAGQPVHCEVVQDRMDGVPQVPRDRRTFAWCVASLTIPSGPSIPVVLDYGRLMSEIYGGSSPNNGRRTVYPVWPAGWWRGSVRRFDLEIDMGAFAGRAKIVSPAGAAVSGRSASWTFENVDLRSLGDIVVDVADYRNRNWPDGGWVRAPVTFSATASSTLAPEKRFSYAASNTVDGRVDTAWCEGVPGDGVGSQLSVSWDLPAEDAGSVCQVRDFVLVPGLARDEALYAANGRVAKARIESCERPEDGFEVQLSPVRHEPNLEPPDIQGLHPREVHVPEGVLSQERRCVRLVILAVEPGSKYHDTCVSEFVPRVYCRAGPAK